MYIIIKLSDQLPKDVLLLEVNKGDLLYDKLSSFVRNSPTEELQSIRGNYLTNLISSVSPVVRKFFNDSSIIFPLMRVVLVKAIDNE